MLITYWLRVKRSFCCILGIKYHHCREISHFPIALWLGNRPIAYSHIICMCTTVPCGKGGLNPDQYQCWATPERKSTLWQFFCSEEALFYNLSKDKNKLVSDIPERKRYITAAQELLKCGRPGKGRNLQWPEADHLQSSAGYQLLTLRKESALSKDHIPQFPIFTHLYILKIIRQC